MNRVFAYDDELEVRRDEVFGIVLEDLTADTRTGLFGLDDSSDMRRVADLLNEAADKVEDHSELAVMYDG